MVKNSLMIGIRLRGRAVVFHPEDVVVNRVGFQTLPYSSIVTRYMWRITFVYNPTLEIGVSVLLLAVT